MKNFVYLKAAPYSAGLLLALAILLGQFNPAFAESQGRHSILLIYPFDRSLTFSAKLLSGLTSALEPHDLNTFEIFQESLDLDRIESSEYLDSLAAFYGTKYASKKFDAIVTAGDLALDFLLRQCDSLWLGTPVIAVGASKEKYPLGSSSRKIIPIQGDSDLRPNIGLILHLQPMVKKIYLISGAHPYERGTWSHLRQVISQYKDGPEFVFMADSGYEELLDTAKGLNANDAILFLSFMRDKTGRSYRSQSVVSNISKVAGCPVYALADMFMECGIVGGAMFPVYGQGFAAGRALLSLFGMENVATGPGEMRVPRVMQVDERQMARWGLLERNLPEGYEVVNRSPSLLRDYKIHVVVALLFFAAQSALIIRLLVLGRIRRAAEQELRGAYEVLENNQAELSHARSLQERTLENLRESEMTLQSILASIPVAVLIIDTGNRTVKIANRAAVELFGMPFDGIIGSPCPDCLESFVNEEVNEPLQYGSNSFEDRIVNARGEEVYVLKTVDRVSIGGRTHLIGCLLDITRRKAAEREAREREDQLFHADKMISMGIMAASVAHEIHNPNNFILMNAPTLQRTWEGVLKKLDEYAEENGDFFIGKIPYSRVRVHMPTLLKGIIEGSRRIKTIVCDMKDFVSTKNSEKSEKVDINGVLRSSLNLLASKLNRSTNNLLVEYGENIPKVMANVQRLEQVAINLILNAAESLADKDKSLSVRSYYEPERAMVVLEVRDSGMGIEPQILDRVFDPFFTTKQDTGGTGLGLAVSQKIVETYGGRIMIVSTPGEGTIAVLYLPACIEDK